MLNLLKVIATIVTLYIIIGAVVVCWPLTKREPAGPIQHFIADHKIICTIVWPVALIAWPFSFLWKNYMSFTDKYLDVVSGGSDYEDVPSKRQLKKEDPELYEKVVNYSPDE
jgi:hypothetical protein